MGMSHPSIALIKRPVHLYAVYRPLCLSVLQYKADQPFSKASVLVVRSHTEAGP